MPTKRFVFPVEFPAGSPAGNIDHQFYLEDYNTFLAVSWVGQHGNNTDVKIQTGDGKEPIVDSLPIDYYKLGNGREEMIINRMLTNNSIRFGITHLGGGAVRGAFVVTAEKQ